MTALIDEVRGLVAEGVATAGDGLVAAELAAIGRRLDEPLRVAFAGRVKAGKSTLLNALVGEVLAPTDAGECTRIVTWYDDGHTYRVLLHGTDGSVRQAPFRREDGALDIDLGGAAVEDVARIEVQWPSRRLAGMTLIDTPGLGSAHASSSAPTQAFLAMDDGDEPSDADAVIYLMRHLHQADLGFLEAFHDDVGRASPVNTVAVLSRADEVGACRPEAMQTARRIAARYRGDARLRRLSQTVIPVSGLVAQASLALTEADHRALASLAALPRDEVEDLLLTVDRFVADGAVEVTTAERSHLLDLLGLYGVRTSIRLIRAGAADTAGRLAEELRGLSGIEDLRRLLTSLFGARRDLLKARAALVAIEAVLREHELEDGPLGAAVERVVASAHELTELVVISSIRNGTVPFRPDEVAEVERLLDRPGASLAERLDVEPGAERAALHAAIDRWRRRAESPMSSRAVVESAGAVIRTLEGALVELLADGSE